MYLPDLAKSFLTIWALVGAAAILSGGGVSPWVRMVALALLGVLGMVGAMAAGMKRQRRIREVERAALALLSRTGVGESGPETGTGAGGPTGGAAGAAWATATGVDDLASLRSAVERLGGQTALQYKELAKKSRNLEALIDALDEPVLATDNQDRVLLCNRSAEALLHGGGGRGGGGGGAGGLKGRPIASVFTHADILEMHRAARAGETRRGRVRVVTELGGRVFQVSASPVPVAWGEGVYGAVLALRDVTELDRAVRVKSDFVANASHELRTPVTAITGAVEALRSGAKDDPAMCDRLLTMAAEHAARLEEMIRDLLDLSRLEAPEVTPEIEGLDPARLLAALGAMFAEVCAERGLTLELDLHPSLQDFRTDPKLLLLILRNLIENATKFAYDRTAIRVTGTRTGAGPGSPWRNGLSGGSVAREGMGWGVGRFEVTDRGIGIPLHLRERVFERYFQVDPARTPGGFGGNGVNGGSGITIGGGGAGSMHRRGTGLGLAIVKHAVKVLGGEVGLDSVWKEGTRVWVVVPEGEGSGREGTEAPRHRGIE